VALIAFMGSTGAPGTTTAALGMLLTWPLSSPERRVVLIEANPDGGRSAAGFLQGQMGGRWSLYNLAASVWQGSLRESFAQQLLDVGTSKEPGRRLLLPGLRGPAVSTAPAMEPVWEPLATLCASLQQADTDVLIDLGFNGAFGPSAGLALGADVVAVVVRRRMASLDDASARIEVLRPALAEAGNADALRLLIVDDGPYDKKTIANDLRVPLLAEVPFSVKHAQPLSDGPASSVEASSILMRSYRTAAHNAIELIAARRARLMYPGPAGARSFR